MWIEPNRLVRFCTVCACVCVYIFFWHPDWQVADIPNRFIGNQITLVECAHCTNSTTFLFAFHKWIDTSFINQKLISNYKLPRNTFSRMNSWICTVSFVQQRLLHLAELVPFHLNQSISFTAAHLIQNTHWIWRHITFNLRGTGKLTSPKYPSLFSFQWAVEIKLFDVLCTSRCRFIECHKHKKVHVFTLWVKLKYIILYTNYFK